MIKPIDISEVTTNAMKVMNMFERNEQSLLFEMLKKENLIQRNEFPCNCEESKETPKFPAKEKDYSTLEGVYTGICCTHCFQVIFYLPTEGTKVITEEEIDPNQVDMIEQID